ncbi:hypothetical protein [Halorubrum sp. CGM4_25_10-8A]|jgi:hypothetical protein|uniref:hypothetical protein n=1 Tax=Halorubrum sp. CGM4_25_10-8A TaxID=2518116 RepID=UPI0010F57271|nr:hypothetical protein [Halorubrum sp. CGM4_25_10-8A]TKX40004.1 hypothetical protein EXE52_08640 [Halorubrum sp. CGM4_25_10-8A]
MSDLRDELRTEIDALGGTDDRVDIDVDHDPVNGRWLEKKFAEALERWGYHTARNKHLFGLETDVIGRRSRMRNDPDDFIVAECKDWHTTLVGREAVASISHRALLARAMPVLVVAWGVTTPAWCLAQLLDVRIVTIGDLSKDSLPPLTEHRPPTGTFRTRREPCVSELRNHLPYLLKRPSELDIEAPVFFSGGRGPCYVPDRDGNDEYANAYDADYNFG